MVVLFNRMAMDGIDHAASLAMDGTNSHFGSIRLVDRITFLEPASL